jgi:hypothetical protein
MSDPQRLRETTTDDFERSLLASLRGDEPTDADRRAVLAAVGVVLPAATATVAVAGTATSWFAGLKVSALTIAVASAVIVGGVIGVALIVGERPPAVADAEQPARTASIASAPPAPSATERALPTDHEPASIDVSSLPSAPNGAAPPPRASAPSAPSAPVAPSAPAAPALAEEIALIDRARGFLGARDPSRALDLLDTYDRHPGNLAHEATALRVEALAMRGDRARAAQVARVFLTEHPRSPLAARIRTLAHIDDETIP